MQKHLRNCYGQSLVEFAIIAPVLLLIMFAIMQFGVLFHDYIVVSEAAREGARFAAVGNDDASITTKVKAAASSINPTKLTIIIVPGARKAGDTVTVTVRTPVELKLPFVDSYVPEKLEGKVVMRMEKDYSP